MMCSNIIIRRILGFFMAVALLSGACGCTRNNGDIGSIFGIWRLAGLEVDGVEADDYEYNCFWSFQNNIISFVMLDAPEDHTALRRWCTFDKAEGYLTLDLSHHGNGINDYLYSVPAFLRLPQEEAVPLKIVTDTGSKMVLTYTGAEGEVITYTLIKQ